MQINLWKAGHRSDTQQMRNETILQTHNDGDSTRRIHSDSYRPSKLGVCTDPICVAVSVAETSD